jgi:ketosteroid isomerase-like protein
MGRSLGIVILIFAAAFLPSCTTTTVEQAATPPAPVETPENIVALIEKLEHEWVDAIERKDTATLDRLLADDFAGTSATAHTFPKSFAIEDIQNGSYAVESMDIDEISVNVYNNDTAVAFVSQDEKSKFNGKDSSGHYHFTNVWVKRNGSWNVVASHGTRMVEAH